MSSCPRRLFASPPCLAARRVCSELSRLPINSPADGRTGRDVACRVSFSPRPPAPSVLPGTRCREFQGGDHEVIKVRTFVQEAGWGMAESCLTHARARTHARTRTQTHRCTHVMLRHAHARARARTHTHTYTHTHTHTHTHQMNKSITHQQLS